MSLCQCHQTAIDNTMTKTKITLEISIILFFRLLLKHSYTEQLQTITNCILYTASIYNSFAQQFGSWRK